jgi:hypothetical protein
MADDKKKAAPKGAVGVKVSMLVLIAIILVSVFGVQIMSSKSIHTLKNPAQESIALYVCSPKNDSFDTIAKMMDNPKVQKYGNMAMTFFLMFIVLMTLWTLYQNLLQDKFVQKSWEQVIALSIIWGIMAIAWTLLTHTPNSYREVKIKGRDAVYVLCEAASPGSKAVRATALEPAFENIKK